jgi:zinc transport system substrate-binding protein
MKRFLILFGLLVLALGAACSKPVQEKVPGQLHVVTTLFPLYDFAQRVGGDKVKVTLLLPPGVEPHSFEPKPADIVAVNQADLFIFTNRYMEPWSSQLIAGLDGRKVMTVEAGRGATLLKGGEAEHPGHTPAGDHQGAGMDPHIWLDFSNARMMVANISAALTARDPANAARYAANAAEFSARLKALDDRYQTSLTRCQKRTFLHGGHYTFGYLARRYGLQYQSAYGVNADSEPTPSKIAAIIKQLRSSGVKHIYTEELLNPQVAETIARETGATLLPLHGAHNISKDDLARGVTFLSLMEQNLINLEKGLQCR